MEREPGRIGRRHVRSPQPRKAVKGRKLTVSVTNTGSVAADEVFLWWNEKAGDMTPAAGEWELMVGGSSDRLQCISFKR